MNKQKILIIGSGLSGLSCATYLDKNKYDVSIYEKCEFMRNYNPGRSETNPVCPKICLFVK